jgi:hypothetical protein
MLACFSPAEKEMSALTLVADLPALVQLVVPLLLSDTLAVLSEALVAARMERLASVVAFSGVSGASAVQAK